MAIALLADIHANLEALRACLAHARSRGVTRYAFLGDLVGYGADPGPVVDLVAEHAAAGAVVIKGNHDASIEGGATYLNESAAYVAEWTREVLSTRQVAFLSGLPLVARDGPVCFVHASAAVPARWDYVDSPSAAAKSVEAAEATYIFSGHVHDQVLYTQGAGGRMVAFRPSPGSPVPTPPHRKWLAIAGSVGQPRDRNPAAAYAIADIEAGRITFHRVPYDHLAAAQRIRDEGLPASLAFRIERGI
jgi:diadenosine tetraphosphatase ApaH/serine/threonine PP2A family protein phosphatase